MFEMRRLQLLHALSSHGTIAAVGQALSLTGSAVSQQLSVLEREVGLPLVERDGRRLRLTSAGQTLVSHTEVLLDQLAAAEADLVALRGEVSGEVRIASFATLAQTVLPLAWRALAREHGDRLRLSLLELEPEASLAALRTGTVDLAVAHAYDTVPIRLPNNVERHDLFVDPIVAVLPAGDELLAELSPADGLDVALLADRKWISSPQGTSCFQMGQRACGRAGFVPAVIAHTGDFTAQIALVAAHVGVAVIPRLATAYAPPGVVFRELAAPVNRSIFAVSRPSGDRHPAVRVAVDALSEAAREWQRSGTVM